MINEPTFWEMLMNLLDSGDFPESGKELREAYIHYIDKDVDETTWKIGREPKAPE